MLRAQNVFFLKQNGKVFYIDRAIDSLATDGRPLSIDKERLREMFIQREKKYKLSADEIIDNNGDIDYAIEQIMGYEQEDFSN